MGTDLRYIHLLNGRCGSRLLGTLTFHDALEAQLSIVTEQGKSILHLDPSPIQIGSQFRLSLCSRLLEGLLSLIKRYKRPFALFAHRIERFLGTQDRGGHPRMPLFPYPCDILPHCDTGYINLAYDMFAHRFYCL